MDFYWDNGLFLGNCRLAVDSTRTRQAAFCSHAHADHLGRHGITLCSSETEVLARHRLRPKRAIFRVLRWGEPFDWGDLRLTIYPAGHCLGSAVLLVETSSRRRILYTGDFKLTSSVTAGVAQLPQADVLIMESTFGDPRYRLPPRQMVIDQLIAAVQAAFGRGQIPVIEAYALGKSQEVTRLLSDAGFVVDQAPEIAAISNIYEQFGVHVGLRKIITTQDRPDGHAVLVVSPRTFRHMESYDTSKPMDTPMNGKSSSFFRIAVTGWANHPQTVRRLGVDLAIPLSDHADYAELWNAIEQVSPQEIYCTHGPFDFAGALRQSGWNATTLESPPRCR